MKKSILAKWAVCGSLFFSGCAGAFTARSPYEANLAKGMKTPETSSLFVKHVDPTSKVVSYLLKSGLIEDNQQSIYFTSKSMTDDGRFILLDISQDERKPRAKRTFGGKHKALIDLMTDTFIRLDDIDGQIPFIDVRANRIYYARFNKVNQRDSALYRRDLSVDPRKEIKVCAMPEELVRDAKYVRFFTHLTLSHDRTKAYLDSRIDDRHVQGVLDLTTGKYTPWGETGLININHGQINPVRDDIALNAWECVPWTDSKGVKHGIEKQNGIYPRLQLISPGKREMVPPISQYATHERWNEQGTGFYWCASGVWYCDLATREQYQVSPIGTHAMMSDDMNLVVADNPTGPWYRGCRWSVFFWNRTVKSGVFIHTDRPMLCEKTKESKLHPDPHPQFVCGDRYIICTINTDDGRMAFSVTPVAPLVARTNAMPGYLPEKVFHKKNR